ncbi:MAG: type III secretion system chaperone family protein, partial [Candidatus Nanopelagicales bacterium]
MTEGAAVEAIRAYLDESGLHWEPGPGSSFVAVLPGEHKLGTTVSLAVGRQAVTVNAFVARHPDENHDAVHRWLLERNRRMYGVAFAIDRYGDIYLVGHLPHPAVTPDELDRVLGCVLEYADGSFNTILGLGFAGAIRREWTWRISRGESTANLAAFAHLADRSGEGSGDGAGASAS